MLGRKKEIFCIILILLLGITIRCRFSGYFGLPVSEDVLRLRGFDDQDIYIELAENLLSGKGLSVSSPRFSTVSPNEATPLLWSTVSPNVATSFWTPIYPLWVALNFWLSGHSLAFVKIAQCVLGSITCIIIYLIASKVINQRVGLISATAACLYPWYLIYSGLIMSEVVFIFFLTITVYILILVLKAPTLKNSVILGCLFGLSVLTRPEIIAFFPLMLLLFLSRFSKQLLDYIKYAGILSVSTAVVLSPWLIRNYKVNSFLGLSTRLGINLWLQNEHQYDLLTNLSIEEQAGPCSSSAVDKDLSKLANEHERDRYYIDREVEFIKNHPAFYSKLGLKRLFGSFLSIPHSIKVKIYPCLSGIVFGESEISEDLLNPYNKPRFYCLAQIIYILIFLLGIFGGISIWKNRLYRQNIQPLYSIVLFYVFLITFIVGGEKFRLPADFVFIIFASYTLDAVCQKLLSRKTVANY